MRIVLAVTTGLVLQVVLWSIGAQPFDAFMAFVAVLIAAATAELVLRYLGRE